jgi:hypothetical protein
MSCRNIIFCKPTGLNSNLVNLLILNDYCIKNHLKLIFFIKKNHLKIVKQFNTIAKFIIVDDEYVNFSCGFNYRKLGYICFSTKLKLYIKKYFLVNLDINDTYFCDGYNKTIENIPLCKTNILLYKIYKNELINITKRKIKVKNNLNLICNSDNKNILSLNLVNMGGNQKLVYNFWDCIIKENIKKYSDPCLFFVSGDYKMLKYFTLKYSSINNINDKSYESVYSSTVNSVISKGSSNDIFYDIINCSFTNFKSLHVLRNEFPEIFIKFKEVNFINRTEHFDFLVEHFSGNIKLL